LAALAAAQHGVVSLDQLCALGISDRAVHSRADCGRLHRIHHSVYSLAPLDLLGRDGRFMAAVLACGPTAALSHRSAAALHETLRLLDISALLDQIERNQPRPAAKRLRAVLDEHYIGSTPTWSELEEALLAACRRAGLPIPEVNAWIDPGDDDPTAIRVDFVWREQRVIVETDGHGTHHTRQAFE